VALTRGVFCEITIPSMKANSFIKRLIAAFSFLTIFFPAARRKEYPAASLAFLPVVGLVLGLFLWLCAYVLDQSLYPTINALVLVTILTICTRGIPLEGLGALLDAVSRGGTAKEMGRAMRASQRGTAGVIAISLALLAKYLLMSQLIEEGALPSLILFPTLGRWSLVCLVWLFPTAQEEGLVGSSSSQDLWGATALTLLCSLLTQGLAGLGIMVLVWVSTYAFGRYCIRRIGGITPQVMGAGAELIELFSLAAIVALLSGL
jgi:adenosylcobinamide-GDP ribazoletransferase